jgi:hypothetical protein
MTDPVAHHNRAIGSEERISGAVQLQHHLLHSIDVRSKVLVINYVLQQDRTGLV